VPDQRRRPLTENPATGVVGHFLNPTVIFGHSTGSQDRTIHARRVFGGTAWRQPEIHVIGNTHASPILATIDSYRWGGEDDMIDVTQFPDQQASVIYAIGDIHGRLDLLDLIEKMIAEDIVRSGEQAPLICYLGDYIDRGPHSAQVIDRLCSYTNDGVRRLFLAGNHEDRMIDFLVDPIANGPAWMKFGGREALESYGLAVPVELGEADWQTLCAQLEAALPHSHRDFLSSLLLGVRWRGYLLVHAGLDPERPITAQVERDLMWIREPFLSSERDWGFKVIHGHVITEKPVFRANRIGIDTGAYQSGCLTCLVLSGEGERLIQTGPVMSKELSDARRW